MARCCDALFLLAETKVAMTTVISSHVKDKNCIFIGYQIFVTGNILVFHRCPYNNNNNYYYNLCSLLALSHGSDDSVIETDRSKFHLVKCSKVRCSMYKLRPNVNGQTNDF